MRHTIWILTVLLFSAASASGQTPAPPKTVTASASLGLALTSGNKDTSVFNAGFNLALTPPTRNAIKTEALFLRGKTDGELSSDRLVAQVRDEFKIHDGFFVFGQGRYLSDRFKDIDYLIAPTGGLGYRVIDTPETKLSVDAGAGGAWERATDAKVRASGAITLDQRLQQKVSATATVTQSVAALWKTQDIHDALYTVGVGVALAVTERTEVTVQWLDAYKARPTEGIEKNDVSIVLALTFKN